jgi:hypothetical protein
MSKIDFDCDFVLCGSGVVLARPQTIEAGQWLGPNRFIDHRRAGYVMHLMMDDGFRVAVNGFAAEEYRYGRCSVRANNKPRG